MSERSVRLELTSKCRTYDIPANQVKPLDQIEDNKVHDLGYMEPKTPMHGGKMNPMAMQSPGFQEMQSPGWTHDLSSPAYDANAK